MIWSPRTISIHESGHCIACVVLGYDVAWVTIRLDGGGLTRHETCPADDGAIIEFAGGLAQLLFSDQPTEAGCASDATKINERLGVVRGQELRMRSLQLVLEHERHIRAVADYLVLHGEIGDPDHSDPALFASEIIKTLNVT
jgi:hypothetical protein